MIVHFKSCTHSKSYNPIIKPLDKNEMLALKYRTHTHTVPFGYSFLTTTNHSIDIATNRGVQPCQLSSILSLVAITTALSLALSLDKLSSSIVKT